MALTLPQADNLWLVGAAFVANSVAMAFAWLSWRALLTDLGGPVGTVPSARIYFVGFLAKFAPGRFWPLLANVRMGGAVGVTGARMATVYVLSMVISSLVGLTVGLAAAPAVLGAATGALALAALPVAVVLAPDGLGVREGILLVALAAVLPPPAAGIVVIASRLVCTLRSGRDRAGFRDLLTLLRPGQWLKNLLVVSVPLVDLRTWSATAVGRIAVAVLAFTVASGLVYVVNDIADRHRDAAHPHKRLRPIASGWVTVRAAALLAAGQAALLAGIVAARGWAGSWPILAYLALSLAYSARLKHVPILDVFAVASGFVLRLVQGYLAVGQAVSGWLATSVFALCLLLTIGKRRHELTVSGVVHRPAPRGYTVALTEQLMLLSAVLTVGAYLLFLRTEAPLAGYATAAAILSTPFALFGVFRYLQLVMTQGGGGRPVCTLLRDPVMLANSTLWALLSAGFLLAAYVAVPG